LEACDVTAGLAVRDPHQKIRKGQISLWGSDSYHASSCGHNLEALVIFGSITGRDPRSLGAGEIAAAEFGIAAAAHAVALQKLAFETFAIESLRMNVSPGLT